MKLIRPSQHKNFDYAAVYGVADALLKAADAAPGYPTSEIHEGLDEAMRQAVSVGVAFENWACEHVDFDKLNDVYSYYLQDHFDLVFMKSLKKKRRHFSCLIGREEEAAKILKLPLKKKGKR